MLPLLASGLAGGLGGVGGGPSYSDTSSASISGPVSVSIGGGGKISQTGWIILGLVGVLVLFVALKFFMRKRR